MAHGGGEVGGDDHTTRYTRATMSTHIHIYIYIYTSRAMPLNMSTWSCFAVSNPIFMFFMFVMLSM